MCLDSWTFSTDDKMTNRYLGMKHSAEIRETISFGRLGCTRNNNVKVVLKETQNDSED